MLPAAAFVLYSLLVQDSVAFRVHAPTSVRVGEPVPIELVLTNRTERRLTLYLQGVRSRLFAASRFVPVASAI